VAADAGPVPTAFVAVTVKVYAVPLASPSTSAPVCEVETLAPPGVDVTV
jgi:hypothetical protein